VCSIYDLFSGTFLKTCSQQATAMLERAQGEFREIRPLKKLLSLLYAMATGEHESVARRRPRTIQRPP
jgi:hypothetical protein